MRVNNGLTPQELEAYGISDVHDIVYNPSYDLLYQEELDPSLTGYERGVLTNLGAVAVDTGIFTGRSPKDKYIVRDDTTRDTFWWADKGKGKNDNKPLSPETWQHLKGLVTRQLSGKRLFVVDAFCGANPDTRLSVRFITEVAWQAHFVKNMFIRPSDEELAGFKPDFIVMNGADWRALFTASGIPFYCSFWRAGSVHRRDAAVGVGFRIVYGRAGAVDGARYVYCGRAAGGK